MGINDTVDHSRQYNKKSNKTIELSNSQKVKKKDNFYKKPTICNREKTIIEIKNKLSVGDIIEIIVPGKIETEKFEIEQLWDIETDEEITTVNPGRANQKVKMKIPYEIKENWILRRKK